jgi:hypothetical protein
MGLVLIYRMQIKIQNEKINEELASLGTLFGTKLLPVKTGLFCLITL